MTLRGKKRVLVLLSLGCWALTAAVVLWGTRESLLPQPVVRSSSESHSKTRKSSAAKSAPALAESAFEAHWERPLRRPLYDPPPPVPPPVVKEPLPPLQAKLLATMVEPGKTMAMLQLPGGQVVFRKVGEVVGPEPGNPTIAEIQPGAVTVTRGDETTKLFVDGAGNN